MLIVGYNFRIIFWTLPADLRWLQSSRRCASNLSLAVAGFVIRGLLLTGSQLLPIAEVEETVRSAEVDLHVIRPALFVRVDPFAVEHHRLTATDAVQRKRPLVSPQREFHHL